MSQGWEADFVAASVAIGEPIAVVVACLDGAGAARVSGIVERLEGGTRATRAAALAEALARFVTDLEGMGLR